MFSLIVNAAEDASKCGLFKGQCTTFNGAMELFLLPSMQAIAIGVAIIYLLYGAIQYITSAGEEKATKTATATLTNAAIGLAIALLIVMIIQVFKSVLTGQDIQSGFPSGIITR